MDISKLCLSVVTKEMSVIAAPSPTPLHHPITSAPEMAQSLPASFSSPTGDNLSDPPHLTTPSPRLLNSHSPSPSTSCSTIPQSTVSLDVLADVAAATLGEGLGEDVGHQTQFVIEGGQDFPEEVLTGIQSLTVDAIRSLSIKSLATLFTRLFYEAETRLFTAHCAFSVVRGSGRGNGTTMVDTCDKSFTSYGSSSRATASLNDHLAHHLYQVVLEAEEEEDSQNLRDVYFRTVFYNPNLAGTGEGEDVELFGDPIEEDVRTSIEEEEEILDYEELQSLKGVKEEEVEEVEEVTEEEVVMEFEEMMIEVSGYPPLATGPSNNRIAPMGTSGHSELLGSFQRMAGNEQKSRVDRMIRDSESKTAIEGLKTELTTLPTTFVSEGGLEVEVEDSDDDDPLANDEDHIPLTFRDAYPFEDASNSKRTKGPGRDFHSYKGHFSKRSSSAAQKPYLNGEPYPISRIASSMGSGISEKKEEDEEYDSDDFQPEDVEVEEGYAKFDHDHAYTMAIKKKRTSSASPASSLQQPTAQPCHYIPVSDATTGEVVLLPIVDGQIIFQADDQNRSFIISEDAEILTMMGPPTTSTSVPVDQQQRPSYPPMPRNTAGTAKLYISEEWVPTTAEEEDNIDFEPQPCDMRANPADSKAAKEEWVKQTALKHIRYLRGRKKKDNYTLTRRICNDGKIFTAAATLLYHYRSHAGIKAFVCQICNTSFTRQHSLNYHMLIHNGQNRFTCDVCSRQFRHPQHYKEHLRRHTGETPFSCPDCAESFKTRNTFKRHLKLRHLKMLTAENAIRDMTDDEITKLRGTAIGKSLPRLIKTRPGRPTILPNKTQIC